MAIDIDPERARQNQTINVAEVLSHPDLAPDAPDGGAATNSTAQEFYQSHTPVPTTEDKPTQTAPPEPPPAPVAPSAPPAPSGGLLFGKYRSMEEAERGFRELNKTLRERSDENVALKAKALAYETMQEISGGFRRERPEPAPEPTTVPVQFDAQNQPFIPLADIQRRSEERAQQIARETVQSILTPITKLNEATTTMRNAYPEFNNAEGAFTAWLQGHPDYIERISKDPEFALEAAYLRFSREAGAVIAGDAVQTAQAAQQQVDAARAQASPAGGATPATRRPTESDNYQARLKEAIEYAKRTGDKRPYKNLIAEKFVGNNFLGPLEKTDWGR